MSLMRSVIAERVSDVCAVCMCVFSDAFWHLCHINFTEFKPLLCKTDRQSNHIVQFSNSLICIQMLTAKWLTVRWSSYMKSLTRCAIINFAVSSEISLRPYQIANSNDKNISFAMNRLWAKLLHHDICSLFRPVSAHSHTPHNLHAWLKA